MRLELNLAHPGFWGTPKARAAGIVTSVPRATSSLGVSLWVSQPQRIPWLSFGEGAVFLSQGMILHSTNPLIFQGENFIFPHSAGLCSRPSPRALFEFCSHKKPFLGPKKAFPFQIPQPREAAHSFAFPSTFNSHNLPLLGWI